MEWFSIVIRKYTRECNIESLGPVAGYLRRWRWWWGRFFDYNWSRCWQSFATVAAAESWSWNCIQCSWKHTGARSVKNPIILRLIWSVLESLAWRLAECFVSAIRTGLRKNGMPGTLNKRPRVPSGLDRQGVESSSFFAKTIRSLAFDGPRLHRQRWSQLWSPKKSMRLECGRVLNAAGPHPTN